MKRLLAASLAVIIAIALCACTAQSSTSSVQPQGGNESNSQKTPAPEESKKKISIVIAPPAGWEPIPNSVLQVQYMKDLVSFMVKEERFQGDNLEAVIAEAKGAFEGAFDDVSYIGEPEAITVDNKEAQKLLFTCKVSEMQMKYEYIYLFEGESVYAITFGGPTESFNSLSSDYEQILQNISFQ